MEEPKGRKKWEGHTVFQTRHKDGKHELTAAVRTVLGLVLCKTGPASRGGGGIMGPCLLLLNYWLLRGSGRGGGIVLSCVPRGNPNRF